MDFPIIWNQATNTITVVENSVELHNVKIYAFVFTSLFS